MGFRKEKKNIKEKPLLNSPKNKSYPQVTIGEVDTIWKTLFSLVIIGFCAIFTVTHKAAVFLKLLAQLVFTLLRPLWGSSDTNKSCGTQ